MQAALTGDQQRLHLLLYGREYGRPVTPRGLAKEAHAWIPGAVAPVSKPAPVRHLLQQHPSRLAEPSGEMRDRGIARDHEIQSLDDRRGVEEGLRARVELLA